MTGGVVAAGGADTTGGVVAAGDAAKDCGVGWMSGVDGAGETGGGSGVNDGWVGAVGVGAATGAGVATVAWVPSFCQPGRPKPARTSANAAASALVVSAVLPAT